MKHVVFDVEFIGVGPENGLKNIACCTHEKFNKPCGYYGTAFEKLRRMSLKEEWNVNILYVGEDRQIAETVEALYINKALSSGDRYLNKINKLTDHSSISKVIEFLKPFMGGKF